MMHGLVGRAQVFRQHARRHRLDAFALAGSIRPLIYQRAGASRSACASSIKEVELG